MIINSIFIILGTIIGAGFASGKEIYTFFYIYGEKGIIGILISSIIIGSVIYKTLKLSEKYSIDNYKELLKIIVKSEKINSEKILEIIVNIFLLTTFFIMCAGFTAYFKQEFQINKLLSSIIIALSCYFILNRDIKGISLINLIIMPIIVLSLIWLGTRCNIENKIYTIGNKGWILQGILYASYNSITLVPMLLSIKKYIKSKKDIVKISIICAIAIFFLAIIIFIILRNISGEIKNIEIPTVYVARKISSKIAYLYGTVVLGAIMTTAISSAYSFLKNISKDKKEYKKYNKYICILSIITSHISFSNLVSNIYPIFGILGIIQLILILKYK